MDKVTLDFENDIVEWDADNYKGTESCPGLRDRKDDILAAMGYKTWDMSNVVNAANSFINGEISADKMNDIFDTELETSKTLSFLPLRVSAIDVLHAAKETYANYGDETYAKSKSNGFLRRCGVTPDHGPTHPIRRETLERVIFAMLDEESGEVFWQNLLHRLEPKQ